MTKHGFTAKFTTYAAMAGAVAATACGSKQQQFQTPMFQQAYGEQKPQEGAQGPQQPAAPQQQAPVMFESCKEWAYNGVPLGLRSAALTLCATQADCETKYNQSQSTKKPFDQAWKEKCTTQAEAKYADVQARYAASAAKQQEQAQARAQRQQPRNTGSSDDLPQMCTAPVEPLSPEQMEYCQTIQCQREFNTTIKARGQTPSPWFMANCGNFVLMNEPVRPR